MTEQELVLDETLCAAITNSGAQCKRKPLPDSKYCQIVAHQAQAEPEEEEFVVCGHINRHSIGMDGVLDNLACERELGHDGDHGAWHYEIHFGPSLRDEVNPRIMHPQINFEGDVWGEWSDMAGTPVSEIKPEPIRKKPGIHDAVIASGDFWEGEDLP